MSIASTYTLPPEVVAQRVCDIVLSFPAAAVGGVQWKSIVLQYEKRHLTNLDLSLAALGHCSTGATAPLWDVLRLVNAEETDNPVLALKDAVALTPRPGFMGLWPSLHVILCQIVESNGTRVRVAKTKTPAQVYGVLLAKLKPLLEPHWHTVFEASSNAPALGFLRETEKGSFVRLKKMKHLVEHVILWRDERTTWREAEGVGLSGIDEALGDRHLDVVNTPNDLILCLYASRELRESDRAFAKAVTDPAQPVFLRAGNDRLQISQ